MRLYTTVATVAAVLIGCGGASPPPSTVDETTSDDKVKEPLVRLYLLADVTSISPGQEFRLAARFDVEPSWHVYWTNPGEAGLPTTVKFETPTGFETGDVSYPGPKAFDGGGGVVSYGYEDLVLLSTRVTAPDSASGLHELKVSASWLACREMCIPGEAEASMSLPTAGPEQPSAPANAKMFASHLESLPVPLALPAEAATWRSDQNALEIKLAGAKRAEYYPSVSEQTRLAGQLAIPKDDGVTLVLSYKKDSAEPVAARGVIRTHDDADGGAARFHQLNWSQTP